MPAILNKLSRSGLAINGALLAVVIFLGALVGVVSMPMPRGPEEMTDMELRAALMSAGLTSEPLAAAGVSPEQTTALVNAARSHLASRIQSLRDAHRDVQDANRALSDLQTQVRHGIAGDNPAGQLAAANTSIASTVAARRAIWDGLFEAATAGIASEKAELVQVIQSNGGWKLPTEYLVSARTEATWVALRDALDNARVCARLGEEPSGEAVQLIQNVEAETAVAQARVNLGNLEAVTAAWEAATLPR